MPEQRRQVGQVAVIGAGPHGRVVASTLRAADHEIAGFYDDDPARWGTDVGGYGSVIGPSTVIPDGAPAIIAIGNNRRRAEIAAKLRLDWITVVHPFSSVAPDVRLGAGSLVAAGSVVQVGSKVGEHVIINNRSGVGHDALVEDFVHLTVAHLGAGSTACTGAFLGLGSVVLPGIRVGAWATVGAGAIVSSSVRDGATVVGNPARETMPHPSRASDTASRTIEVGSTVHSREG